MPLSNKSEEIRELLYNVHIEAHGPSGAIVETFNEDDVENFMTIMEGLSNTRKISLIDWLRRTMVA